MTLSPIIHAPIYIQIHLAAALIAMGIGPAALYRHRRDLVHKTLGYIWVVSMATVAISSFFIPSHFGPFRFGLLHGFAIVTLWSLWIGVRHAVARNFQAHRDTFQSLYLNGLLIAGAFTFLPGRTINRMVFGEVSQLGWLVIGAVLILVFYRISVNRLTRAKSLG